MRKNVAILLLSSFLLDACVIHDYKKMTYFGKNNVSEKIKLNGFYTKNWSYNEDDRVDDTTIYTHYTAFYRDGTFFNAGSYPSNEAKKFNTPSKNLWELPYTWGCYLIDNDTINIQKFYHDETYFPFFIKWTVSLEKLIILNDSTIKAISFNYLGKTEILNEVYLFKECNDCKPDSFNFIKKELGKNVKPNE